MRKKLSALLAAALAVSMLTLPAGAVSQSTALETVRALPGVTGADYADARLTVRCQSGGHNLITLLDCLNKQGLSFGRVYSEPPTLNDVFLEITGKELRD